MITTSYIKLTFQRYIMHGVRVTGDYISVMVYIVDEQNTMPCNQEEAGHFTLAILRTNE